MPRGNRTERRGRGFARGAPAAYTVADALSDAHAALDAKRSRYIPVRAARRLVETVEEWEKRLRELEEDRERYVELVGEWNLVCEGARQAGIELASHDGVTWLWSYDGQSGEAATAGAAIAAALTQGGAGGGALFR